MSADDRLRELGLVLPELPQPAGAYVRATRAGSLIFVAGQLPLEKGEVKYRGKLGRDLAEGQGYAAARLCMLNALSILHAEAGSLQAIRLVRLCGFVCSAEGFTGQAKVVNGASELAATVLGPRGVHARLAVGVVELPLGAAVELEVIAEVD